MAYKGFKSLTEERSPTDQSQSKGLRNILFLVGAIGVAGGTLFFSTAPDPTALPPTEIQSPVIQALEVRTRPISSKVLVPGLLQPSRNVELFAEVDGRVVEVGAHDLDRVEADQLLMFMDPLLAEVAVQRARASIARAESQSNLAEANLDRNRGLANVNVASRAALDTSEDASRQAFAAKIEAEAALAEAEDQLSKKTIRAPFSGLLRSFPVEVGEYVRAGERVAELLDVERLEIMIGLTDNQIVDVEKGAPVKIEITALPGQTFLGVVDGVGGAVDSETRKFPVRIAVENEDGKLLPGMVAMIDLKLGQGRNEITLPLDAVVDDFGLKHVFVLSPTSLGEWTARKRQIEVTSIPFLPTQVAVVSGLEEGEQIAISAVRRLRDGTNVRIAPNVAQASPTEELVNQ
ncbi:MAG: hypothetical protein CL917_03770 [Deltaproteobacteria bacterium]|nr:hypothetical protein [Deltaproteobacteria bacterium]